jgi:hypothetical protein
MGIGRDNLLVLKDEINTDPLTRGYAGMSDLEIAVDLKVNYRQRNRDSMTGSEVLNAIVKSEYAALTDAEKDGVWQLIHLGELNPFGFETDLMVDIFGEVSATITALQAARKEATSREAELGLPRIYARDVAKAKAL